MASTTGISWTDKTYNPWWGCTKVSPACDHCYAATMAATHPDALHAAHESGKAKAEQEILCEGAIYSPAAGRMLEIVG